MSTGSISKPFFNKKEGEVLASCAQAILGVPRDDLNEDFLDIVNEYVFGLPSYFHGLIHILLRVFNFPLIVFFFLFKLKSFTRLSTEDQKRYVEKWLLSRIPLFRTGYMTIKALVSWGYYTSDKGLNELDFPGVPLGREHELPTLLYGKEPWSEWRLKKNDL